MLQETVGDPILKENSLLWVAAGTAFLTLAAGVCFTVIVRANPQRAVRAFRGGRALQHITVFTIVFATVLLGLERVLTGEAVASILGGIIGYVLGSLRHISDDPSSPVDNSGMTPRSPDQRNEPPTM